MHDPMALFTDYAMALFAIAFGSRLRRMHRMWALAFVFTALGAIFGGTFHGVAPESIVLWKATVFSVGIASFFFLAGTSPRLAAVAVVKLVLYSSWMITHDAFLFVIVDYGITLLLMAIACLLARSRATPWIIGSIAVSIAGALVQQVRLTLHPRWFDFNDLYHVIQITALWMLYRAGRVAAQKVATALPDPSSVSTSSATVRSTTPPT